MGARTSSGSIRHSYQSVAGPADALREVVAKRHLIGSGELMGVSLRYEELPLTLPKEKSPEDSVNKTPLSGTLPNP